MMHIKVFGNDNYCSVHNKHFEILWLHFEAHNQIGIAHFNRILENAENSQFPSNCGKTWKFKLENIHFETKN